MSKLTDVLSESHFDSPVCTELRAIICMYSLDLVRREQMKSESVSFCACAFETLFYRILFMSLISGLDVNRSSDFQNLGFPSITIENNDFVRLAVLFTSFPCQKFRAESFGSFWGLTPTTHPPTTHKRAL